MVSPHLATWCTLGLLLVYTVALARLASEREDVACACGGLLGSDRVTWFTVGRDVVLVGLTLVAGRAASAPLWRAAGASLVQVVLAGTAVAVLVYALSAVDLAHPRWGAPPA